MSKNPKPRKPNIEQWKVPEGWKYLGSVPGGDAYRHFTGLAIVYSCDETEPEKYEHHISISYRGHVPTQREIDMTLKDWGFDDWERDGAGGDLPHFWKTNAKASRRRCAADREE